MRIRRYLAISFLEKYANTAINLISTLVLARLLSPAEIGVFSVGAAVAGILHTLRDFGVTTYLIQEREVDREKLRTAFTVTLGLSWIFAAILFLGSGWAAAFYREDGIRDIIWVMAANFLLIPFGSPILALMRRELEFGQLAAMNLTSTAVNATTGIALAATGHGFMSLAWASLAGVAVSSGLAFARRPHAFLFRPGLKEWRSVLSFGAYASGTALVVDLRNSAPDLILGRTLGFEAVGLYSRAIGLLSIFNKVVVDALQQVLLPTLSEKVRRGEDVRETYLRAMDYISVLYWPFLAILAIMADPAIRVLFGDQWVAAVPIVQILCVAWAMGFPGYLTHPLLIAFGKVRTTFALNIPLLPLTAAAVGIGSLYSLEAVALLVVAVETIAVLITFRVLRRLISVSILDVLWVTNKSAVVAALTALVPLAAAVWHDHLPRSPLVILLITGIASFAVWVGAVMLTRHRIAGEMRFVLGWVRHALSRK